MMLLDYRKCAGWLGLRKECTTAASRSGDGYEGVPAKKRGVELTGRSILRRARPTSPVPQITPVFGSPRTAAHCQSLDITLCDEQLQWT